MVQLHYDMNSIKVLIENGCKELGPIYCRVLEDLFYDYMGDTRVSSLSTIRVGLDKELEQRRLACAGFTKNRYVEAIHLIDPVLLLLKGSKVHYLVQTLKLHYPLTIGKIITGDT